MILEIRKSNSEKGKQRYRRCEKENEEQMKKYLTKINQCIFTALMIEIVLGVRGRLLIVGGIPIRYLLFLSACIAIYMKAIYIAYLHRKQCDDCFIIFAKNEMRLFRKFDIALAIFLLLNTIWIFLIPHSQGNSCLTALSEVRYLIAFVIYFPISYLLQSKEINWSYYRKIAKICAIMVVILHIFFYCGELYQKSIGSDTYFVQKLFDSWSRLVHGHCYFTPIIMPKFSIRIIYAFNNIIMLAIYFILDKKNSLLKWLCVAFTITALLTTGTRTVIIAPLIGLFLYYIFKICYSNDRKTEIKKCMFSIIMVIVIWVLIDMTVFQGRTILRLKSSFTISEEVVKDGANHNIYYEDNVYTHDKEIAGTINSNTTRILQLKYIIDNFLKSPIVGYGYGSCGYSQNSDIVCDYIDIQGIAVLMKTGLIGTSIWAIYIIYLFRYFSNQMKKCNQNGGKTIFILTSVIFSTMLCYTLHSMTIMMILFCFIDTNANISLYQQEESINEKEEMYLDGDNHCSNHWNNECDSLSQ